MGSLSSGVIIECLFFRITSINPCCFHANYPSSPPPPSRLPYPLHLPSLPRRVGDTVSQINADNQLSRCCTDLSVFSFPLFFFLRGERKSGRLGKPSSRPRIVSEFVVNGRVPPDCKLTSVFLCVIRQSRGELRGTRA